MSNEGFAEQIKRENEMAHTNAGATPDPAEDGPTLNPRPPQSAYDEPDQPTPQYDGYSVPAPQGSGREPDYEGQLPGRLNDRIIPAQEGLPDPSVSETDEPGAFETGAWDERDG